jgi:hypothetical protein
MEKDLYEFHPITAERVERIRDKILRDELIYGTFGYNIDGKNIRLLTQEEIYSLKDMEKTISIEEALDYEIRSSWWACLLPWDWMHRLAARYFYKRVKRRHARYKKYKHLQAKSILENGY